MIAFACAGEETLLDAIPFAEVVGMQSMCTLEQKCESFFEVDISNAFQIRTKQNGHNAGRKYLLQASSPEDLEAILNELQFLAKVALVKEEASSKWSKLQESVRLVYNSSRFQGTAAFLIVSVRARSASYIILLCFAHHF
jgi:hypothetical protein